MRIPGDSAYLLRNLGLEILTFLHNRVWFGSSSEPTKVVVRKSFWVAFSRCLIHILPVTVSLVLLRLNLRGYYIGHGFSQQSNGDLTAQGNDVRLALIQVAAKVQELLVISSYGVIIFSVTRDQLMREGIPLGIAASGVSFARISYFWSPALWGAISALVTSSKLRGICLVSLISLGGLIAVTAGPASAILMLPRPTNWPEFTTDFWLNGTADVFWPSTLTSDHLGGRRCSSVKGLNTIECVAKGLSNSESFYNYYRSQNSYEIPTQESKFPRTLQGVPRKAGLSAEAWSVAPHAATALLQNYLISDPHWYPVSSRPTGIRYGETYSQAAAVRTVCTRKVLTFSNTTFLVSLPDPPAFDLWARASHRSGKHTDIKLAKPLWGTQKGAHTNKTGLTTVWIPPTSDMESVTAGLVVLSALNSSSATERFAVVCSIDARWNKAKHVLTVKGSNPAVLGNKASDSSSSDVSIVQSSKHDNRALASTVLPINDGSSWRHIAAEQAWLDGLTPLVPQWMDETKTARNKSTMTTAFANLFIATDARLRTDRPKKTMEKYWIQNIETVTSTAMADAISRIGLGRQYWSNKHYTGSGNKCTGIVGAAPRQFCPGPPPYGESSLLTFQGFLTGYAYKASRVTDYLAMLVLLLHMLVAVAHTLYLLLATRRSSAAWDTVEEMLVLALVSRARVTELANTCAGVGRLGTWGVRARVRSVVEVGGEKVQLVVGGDGEEEGGKLGMGLGRVREGVAYGNSE